MSIAIASRRSRSVCRSRGAVKPLARSARRARRSLLLLDLAPAERDGQSETPHAQIAGTGYVRDRPREFADADPPSKAEALKRFDEAVAMTLRTIAAQSAEDWSRPYEAAGAAMCPDRFSIVLRCTAHVFHHVGQMIYLARAWETQTD